jgi:hypothetical protein
MMTAFVLMLVVIPTAIGLGLTRSAFKGMAPSLFHCRRCDREFGRVPHRGFPRRCPHCRSPDWNREQLDR